VPDIQTIRYRYILVEIGIKGCLVEDYEGEFIIITIENIGVVLNGQGVGGNKFSSHEVLCIALVFGILSEADNTVYREPQ
jgi:hypothetical protein